MAEVGVEVGLDTKSFDQSVKKMESSITQLGRTIEQSFSDSKKSLETFKGTLGGLVAFKAAEKIVEGFAKIGEAISDAITIASDKEAELNRLESALIRTGLGGRKATQDFADFADEIEKTTKFTDDAAISSITLLTNLTSLDKNGIKTATKAATELATVLGVDLDTATRTLIKATEGNVTALQRQGISIQKGRTDAETYQNTLNAIAKFSGAAASETNTFSGAQNQLSKSIENVLESLGNTIVKNPLFIGAIKTLGGEFEDLDTGIKNSFQSISDGLTAATNFILSFSKVVIDAADFLYRGIRGVATIVLSALTLPVRAFVATIELAMKAASAVVATFDENFAKSIDKSTQKVSIFSKALNDSVNVVEGFTDESVFTKLSKELDAFALNANGFYVEQKKKADESGSGRIESEKQANEQILNERKKLEADLIQIEAQLEASKAFGKSIGDVRDPAAEAEAAYNLEIGKARAEYEAALVRNSLIQDAQNQELANKKAFLELSDKTEKASSDLKLKRLDEEKGRRDLDLKNQEAFFSTAITLSNSKNKELAAIGKAAALTQLAIKTPEAVGSSFAFGTKTGGPVLGFALAAIASAAMAAQAAQIAGLSFETGGIVPGNSYTGDNIAARVNSKEMVLTQEQQAELFRQANGQGSGNESLIGAISALGDRIERMNIVVMANGRELARLIKEESRTGFSFA